MLKAFVISDLHGGFPEALKEAIMEAEPDVVLCCGDVTPFRLRGAFFEHVYAAEEETTLWEQVGRATYKGETKKDFADAHHVLATLDDLPFPARFIPGNVDRAVWVDEDGESVDRDWAWPGVDRIYPFTKDLLSVKDVSFGVDIVGDYGIIGYPSSSSPGKVQSDPYRRHRRWLDRAFNTFERMRHEDKTVIFMSHNGLYDTKTDLIDSDEAVDGVQGKHFGSKLGRRIVERYQPSVCVHGHIEEGRGRDRVGKTEVVNVGSGLGGSYAVITLDNGVSVELGYA